MYSEKCKVYGVPGVRLDLYKTVYGQCKVYGLPVGRLDQSLTVQVYSLRFTCGHARSISNCASVQCTVYGLPVGRLDQSLTVKVYSLRCTVYLWAG